MNQLKQTMSRSLKLTNIISTQIGILIGMHTFAFGEVPTFLAKQRWFYWLNKAVT